MLNYAPQEGVVKIQLEAFLMCALYEGEAINSTLTPSKEAPMSTEQETEWAPEVVLTITHRSNQMHYFYYLKLTTIYNLTLWKDNIHCSQQKLSHDFSAIERIA
jgi:hypothetical protein